MHFCHVDQVIECGPDRAVTLKGVSLAEEYLQDHFQDFQFCRGFLCWKRLCRQPASR